METRNFPGPPLKNEIALVDQLWAKANVLVRAEWQHGLEAFRDYYDGTANLIRVTSWEDAQALCGALADLEILRHFQIDIRTRRTSSVKISVEGILVRKRAPRGWRGQVIFRLKSRQVSGRDYSIRFALNRGLPVVGRGEAKLHCGAGHALRSRGGDYDWLHHESAGAHTTYRLV
jgi:hypothetical protein